MPYIQDPSTGEILEVPEGAEIPEGVNYVKGSDAESVTTGPAIPEATQAEINAGQKILDEQVAQGARKTETTNTGNWRPDYTKENPYQDAPEGYTSKVMEGFVPSASQPLPPFTGQIVNRDKNLVLDETGKVVTIDEYKRRLPEIHKHAADIMNKETQDRAAEYDKKMAEYRAIVDKQDKALAKLKDYRSGEGYDLAGYLRKHPDDELTLSKAGFTDWDIVKAKAYNERPISINDFTKQYYKDQGWDKDKLGRDMNLTTIRDAQAESAYIKKYGKAAAAGSVAGGMLSPIFLPAKALAPDVTLKDVSAMDWAIGVTQVALLALPFVGGAIGKIGGSLAANIATKSISAGASGVFTAQTVQSWGGMSNQERVISVAMDTFIIGSILPKGVLTKIANKAKSEIGAETVRGRFKPEVFNSAKLRNNVLDTVKVNDLNITSYETKRLSNALDDVANAVKRQDKDAVVKAAQNLQERAGVIKDGTTQLTIQNYAKTMEANPDAFISMAKEIKTYNTIAGKPVDSLTIIKDVNEYALKSARTSTGTAISRKTTSGIQLEYGQKYIKEKSNAYRQIKKVMDNQGTIPASDKYKLLKASGKLPYETQVLSKDVPVDKLKKLYKEHEDIYNKLKQGGKLKETEHYDIKSRDYIKEPESYSEWIRNNPAPQRELTTGTKKIFINPSEFKLYEKFRKNLKASDVKDLANRGYMNMENQALLLKGNLPKSEINKVLQERAIYLTKSRMQSIRGASERLGLDVAVEMYGKQQVSLVYPKLNSASIKAAKTLQSIREKEMAPMLTRNLLKQQYTYAQMVEGGMPSQLTWDNLIRKGVLEPPKITGEKLINYERASSRVPSTVAMDIASAEPTIQVTVGGGWKFTATKPNAFLPDHVYTTDANLVTQVQNIMTHKPETFFITTKNKMTGKVKTGTVYGEGPVTPGLSETYKAGSRIPERKIELTSKLEQQPITNEYPIQEMKKVLQGNIEGGVYKGALGSRVGIHGDTLEDQSDNLVREVQTSVNKEGWVTTVDKYGVNVVSAVYPYYFEYALNEMDNYSPDMGFLGGTNLPSQPQSSIGTVERAGTKTSRAVTVDQEANLEKTSSGASLDDAVSTSTMKGTSSKGATAPSISPSDNPESNPQPNSNPSANPNPKPSPNPQPNPSPQPKPDPSPRPNPNPNPSPNPQPNPNPQPEPQPKPNPDPKPEPIPTPKPNIVVTTTIIKTPPETPKIPNKYSNYTDRQKRKLIDEANGDTIAWRQGELGGKDVWHVIVTPFEQGNYFTIIGRKPGRATLVRGPNSAVKTAQLLYGKELSQPLTVDIGAFDAHLDPITGGKGLAISFKPDPHLQTTSDITISKRPGGISQSGGTFPLRDSRS
jgi:hypothetical protein